MDVFVVCRDNQPAEEFQSVAVFSTLAAAERHAREQARAYTSYLWSIRTGKMLLDPMKEIVLQR